MPRRRTGRKCHLCPIGRLFRSVLASIAILVIIVRGLTIHFRVHEYASVLRRGLTTAQFVIELLSSNNSNVTSSGDEEFSDKSIRSVQYDDCQQKPSSPIKQGETRPSPNPQLENRLTYYVPARGARDRSGAAIIDMLKAQAYSFSKGVKFGGACGWTPHQAKSEEMIRVLGLETLLAYRCPPVNITENERHEMITRNDFFDKVHTYFTAEWLDYIHTRIQPRSQMWQEEQQQQQQRTSKNSSNNNNDNSSSNYTIVMHIRRGDIDPCGQWSFRYLPNSHYLGLLNIYTQRVPANRTAQCIVFSESYSLVENFDDFYNQGCQVILDGEPTVAWKAMLHADVLVLSASSFSIVPAILNRNGIIAYTPHGNRPLRPDWEWHDYKHRNQMWRQLIRLCDNPPKQ